MVILEKTSEGWLLIVDNKSSKYRICTVCKKELNEKGFLCEENKYVLCEKCEINMRGNIRNDICLRNKYKLPIYANVNYPVKHIHRKVKILIQDEKGK